MYSTWAKDVSSNQICIMRALLYLGTSGSIVRDSSWLTKCPSVILFCALHMQCPITASRWCENSNDPLKLYLTAHADYFVQSRYVKVCLRWDWMSSTDVMLLLFAQYCSGSWWENVLSFGFLWIVIPAFWKVECLSALPQKSIFTALNVSQC